MKYIIIGLGNFGGSLATKLVELGHEVIGLDNRMEKVDAYKDRLAQTICMDTTDPAAVRILPLKETDCVIIAIGENEGASIMSAAVMKQAKVKRLIGRAVSRLQSTVLEAMGIEEIIHPEEESAIRLAQSLDVEGVIDSFALTKSHNIVEANVPSRYVGKTIEQVGFRKKYNLNVLSILKATQAKNEIGIFKKILQVTGVVTPDRVLEEDDVLVVYGLTKDIKRLMSAD
jgi:trk system potassium uptake protein